MISQVLKTESQTAYIFPGLNGLLRRADRKRYLHLDEVQARLRQAELALQARFGMKLDLNALLDQSTQDLYAIENISVAAVIICAIQVGVTDRLRSRGFSPDWVMGCSLGDLARAVCAEAYSFEDAICNHVHFTQKIDGIDKIGRNIGVAAPAAAPFNDEDYRWFDNVGVDVSALTPRFLNVGGRYADLEHVEVRAREKGWHIMPILEYPAHSRYILPYVERVQDQFQDVQVLEPKLKMFSSFSCRPIHQPEDIKSEFLLSITQTIHWHRAVTALVRDYGVRQFVNIGPCKSLTRMMGDIPDAAPVIEADQIF